MGNRCADILIPQKIPHNYQKIASMHPSFDRRISFQNFLLKIRGNIHIFSHKWIDQARSCQSISCDRWIRKSKLQLCLTLRRLQKANQTPDFLESLHKSSLMDFICEKLHQNLFLLVLIFF